MKLQFKIVSSMDTNLTEKSVTYLWKTKYYHNKEDVVESKFDTSKKIAKKSFVAP